jgi:hypothetical protein
VSSPMNLVTLSLSQVDDGTCRSSSLARNSPDVRKGRRDDLWRDFLLLSSFLPKVLLVCPNTMPWSGTEHQLTITRAPPP